MKTLAVSIKHERKPEFDEQRIQALENAFKELCPIEDTAEAMVDTLKIMNPAVKEVVMFGNVVMIDISGNIREVNIAGFGFEDVYTSLIAAVLRGGK